MIAADELPFKVGGKDFGGWDWDLLAVNDNNWLFSENQTKNKTKKSSMAAQYP